MRKYETLLLLSPELNTEERKTVLDLVDQIMTRDGGDMLKVDEWGMRDLAYPVRKQMRGYYVRFEYLAPGELIGELERNLRITDGVYKFVTVMLEEEPEGAAAETPEAQEA